jgi:hypothetical protein
MLVEGEAGSMFFELNYSMNFCEVELIHMAVQDIYSEDTFKIFAGELLRYVRYR